MIKVDILIDGTFFLKHLPKVRLKVDMANTTAIKDAIYQLVNFHLQQINNAEHAPN